MCLLLATLVIAETVAPEDLEQISEPILEEISDQKIDYNLNYYLSTNR